MFLFRNLNYPIDPSKHSHLFLVALSAHVNGDSQKSFSAQSQYSSPGKQPARVIPTGGASFGSMPRGMVAMPVIAKVKTFFVLTSLVVGRGVGGIGVGLGSPAPVFDLEVNIFFVKKKSKCND